MTANRLLVWMMVAGLGVASYVIAARHMALADDRNVEMALSLPAARESSVTQAYPFEQILAAYQSAGITTLMVGGTTLQGLMETGGTGFPKDYPILLSVDEGADQLFVSVRGNPTLASWLQERLKARLSPGNVELVESGEVTRWAVRRISREDLLRLNLGVHPIDIALAERSGLRLAVHYAEQSGWFDASALFEGLPRGTPILWTGTTKLPHVGTIGGQMRSRGDLLLIDHSKPPFSEGLAPDVDELATHHLGNRTVKLFRVTYNHAIADVLTAVKERYMRFVLVQPYHISGDFKGDLAAQTKTWGELRARLEQEGFALGPAKPLGEYHPPLWAMVLVGLAVGAAAGLLLESAPSAWKFAAVLAGGGLAWAGGPLGLKVLALLAAVLLPTLGASLALEGQGSSRSLIWLAGTGFAGGLLITALLGDIRFVLELDLFRGIKPALVGPSVLFIALLAWRQRANVRQWVVQPLRLWHLGVAALIVAALVVMLMRSGEETSVTLVSNAELRVRGLLEQVLVVRPRFKEFLIGWPLLVVALYAIRRGARGVGSVLLAAGLMAPASLINSFEHLHTPFGLSVVRGVHGLWIGVLLGGLVVLVLERRRASRV